MEDYIYFQIDMLYGKHKDDKTNSTIHVVVETKFNSYSGILDIGDYLLNSDYIKTNNSSNTIISALKVDLCIIKISDIVAFSYSDVFLEDSK